MQKKVNESQKWVYVSAAVLCGVLVSFVAHSVLEIAYINWLLVYGVAPVFSGRCTLPPLLSFSIASFGILAGLHLGLNWWQSLVSKKSK